MDRLKNVVVGIDFSKYSRHALAQAMRIARWNEAKLYVVHVIEESVAADLARAYGVSDVDIRTDIRGMARRHVDEVVTAALRLNMWTMETRPSDVSFDAEVVVGSPFVEILRRARDVRAELLVLGSNGSSDPSQGLGTLATKCLRYASTEVLLVRGSHIAPFNRIVACVDFSEESRLVVQQAICVARKDDADLNIVHVYSPPWEMLQYKVPTREVPPELRDGYVSWLESQLTQLLAPLKTEIDGLNTTTNLVANLNQKTGIVDFVRSSGADLVLLSSHGHSGSKDTPMGMTAERIVRDVPCSVVVVKPRGLA